MRPPTSGQSDAPRCGQNASASHMRPSPSIQATIFSPIQSRWKSPACSITRRGAMKYQPSGNWDGRGESLSSLRRVVMVPDPLAAPSRQFRRDSLYSLGVCSFSRMQLLVSLYRQCLELVKLTCLRGEARGSKWVAGGRAARNRLTWLAYSRAFRHNVKKRRPLPTCSAPWPTNHSTHERRAT